MAEVALGVGEPAPPFAAEELADGQVDLQRQAEQRRGARRIGLKPGLRIVAIDPGLPFVEIGGLPLQAA
jgi:hypothetical protein